MTDMKMRTYTDNPRHEQQEEILCCYWPAVQQSSIILPTLQGTACLETAVGPCTSAICNLLTITDHTHPVTGTALQGRMNSGTIKGMVGASYSLVLSRKEATESAKKSIYTKKEANIKAAFHINRAVCSVQ